MIQPDTVCGTPAWYLSSTMARQLLCGISIFKSKATGVVASAQMVWSLVMWRARVNMQRAMHYSPTEHRSHLHFLHPPNTRSPNNSRYYFKKRYYLACKQLTGLICKEEIILQDDESHTKVHWVTENHHNHPEEALEVSRIHKLPIGPTKQRQYRYRLLYIQ